MKKTMKLFLLLAVVSGVSLTARAQQHFGSPLSDKEALEATSLPGQMQGKEKLEVKLTGQVVEVCQKKGCWMTVDMGGGETLRVTFKDYGFFVPKDIAGKTVVFEGQASMETVDVETLKHYAEDAGKSEEEIAAITRPEKKLTFVATGVAIAE